MPAGSHGERPAPHEVGVGGLVKEGDDVRALVDEQLDPQQLVLQRERPMAELSEVV